MNRLLWTVSARAARFLDPEQAHLAAIRLLASPLGPRARLTEPTPTVLAGLTFANRLGLAAGFDKHGEVVDALLALGFGHVEIGTVTPKPQPGNPRPRLFRLPEDKGLINRFGFNSEGGDVVARRLARRLEHGKAQGIVGINIGANKESDDRIADYAAGICRFAGLADYYTVNISSPNTPGLRDLQGEDALNRLLGTVMEARAQVAPAMPVFLKVAPDLDLPGMDAIAKALKHHQVSGLIVSNTTLSRKGLVASAKNEAGGLSGKPVFERATAALGAFRVRLGRDAVIIGAGGVSSASEMAEKIAAGADLVQLYSALAYHGFGLPHAILGGLDHELRERGQASADALKGMATRHWAERFERDFALPPEA